MVFSSRFSVWELGLAVRWDSGTGFNWASPRSLEFRVGISAAGTSHDQPVKNFWIFCRTLRAVSYGFFR
jgi:hypothetical protein